MVNDSWDSADIDQAGATTNVNAVDPVPVIGQEGATRDEGSSSNSSCLLAAVPSPEDRDPIVMAAEAGKAWCIRRLQRAIVATTTWHALPLTADECITILEHSTWDDVPDAAVPGSQLQDEQDDQTVARGPSPSPVSPTGSPRSPHPDGSLRAAVRVVVDTFTRDEAQGFRSRDRQFAIEILARALAAVPRPQDELIDSSIHNDEEKSVARGPSPSPASATGSPRSPQRDGSSQWPGAVIGNDEEDGEA